MLKNLVDVVVSLFVIQSVYVFLVIVIAGPELRLRANTNQRSFTWPREGMRDRYSMSAISNIILERSLHRVPISNKRDQDTCFLQR